MLTGGHAIIQACGPSLGGFGALWCRDSLQHLCAQKLLVTHPYKSLTTFGGCKQDFMLVVGQTAKDRPTEKHLFAMDASKVSPTSCLSPSVT